MSQSPITIVYGYDEVLETLVFLPEEVARRHYERTIAANAATTWGEARAVGAPGSDESDDYEDDEPYSASECDNWPIAPATLALDSGLEELEEYGEEIDSLAGLPHLRITADLEEEICTLLRDAGYELMRDDRLVCIAEPPTEVSDR